MNFFRGSDDGGLFYSSNGGDSWIFAGLHDKSVQCVVGVDLDKFIAGTDNWIYISTDYTNTTWTPIYQEVNATAYTISLNGTVGYVSVNVS